MTEVIFDEPRVQETSKEALKKKIRNGTKLTDKERCLHIIREYGPITAEEMELHMGKTQSDFSGRIRDLKDEEKIHVTGHTTNSNGNTVQQLEARY
jgi:predicted HTH transcriptional regulator